MWGATVRSTPSPPGLRRRRFAQWAGLLPDGGNFPVGGEPSRRLALLPTATAIGGRPWPRWLRSPEREREDEARDRIAAAMRAGGGTDNARAPCARRGQEHRGHDSLETSERSATGLGGYRAAAETGDCGVNVGKTGSRGGFVYDVSAEQLAAFFRGSRCCNGWSGWSRHACSHSWPALQRRPSARSGCDSERPSTRHRSGRRESRTKRRLRA